MNKEIKIVGAGLSGLTAGINLLESGYKVTIYEKGEDVGARFNNDFQGIVNWMSDIDVMEAIKKMNIEINFMASPLKEGIFFGSGLKSQANFKSEKPIFYLVKRGWQKDTIDHSLKEQFLRKGGWINFNNSPALEDMDIVATGPKKVYLATAGYNFETNFPNTFCEVIDKNLAPKAYAYLLIRDGRGTLATALSQNFQDPDIYLRKTVEAFEKKLGLSIKNKEKFTGVANFSLPKTAVKNRKLYVGEAAGFQDAFVGLGMFFAIKSGYLAARSIIEKIDYDNLWKKELNNFLKISMVYRFLFEIAGYKSTNIILKTIEKNQKKLLDLIKKGYKFDWKMKIMYPATYLFMKNKIK
jgi:flavin-dependent dehydrogenase